MWLTAACACFYAINSAISTALDKNPYSGYIHNQNREVRSVEDFGALRERIKAHDKQIEEHEGRLNNHEKRLQQTEVHDASVDANIKHVCEQVSGLTKVLWAVAAALAGAALTFLVTLLQNSVG